MTEPRLREYVYLLAKFSFERPCSSQLNDLRPRVVRREVNGPLNDRLDHLNDLEFLRGVG